MTKGLPWRFVKYLGQFHMFTVKVCWETGFFREWSNQDIHSLQFRQYISYDHHVFFSKCLNFDIDSTNKTKNSEKVFGFSDNCI